MILKSQYMILKLYLGNNYISQVFFKLPNPQSLPFTTRLLKKKNSGGKPPMHCRDNQIFKPTEDESGRF